MSDALRSLRGGGEAVSRPTNEHGQFVERRVSPDRRASDTRDGSGRRLDDRLKRPVLLTAAPASVLGSLDNWSHLLEASGSPEGQWGDVSEFAEF